MPHLIESMAFVGATPWHGLGNPLYPQQPLEVWLTESGMDWNENSRLVLRQAGWFLLARVIARD